MKAPKLYQQYFVLCVILYLIVTLFAPVNKVALHQYHLSLLQLRLITIGIFIPIIIIWCVTLYGYLHFLRYSQLISGTKDGKNISGVATALKILALGSPTIAVITTFLNQLTIHHQSWLTPVTIINNYLNLLVPLLAFTIIGIVARRLTHQTDRTSSQLLSISIIVLFAIVSVVYCYFIFSNASITTIYRLPLLLLSLTVVIPYVFIWYTGLLAVIDILMYSRRAKGQLYRRGWQTIAGGFTLIILSSIVIQYTTTLTQRISRLTVGPLLLVLYVLIALIASGYILLARGAKQLQRIEEV